MFAGDIAAVAPATAYVESMVAPKVAAALPANSCAGGVTSPTSVSGTMPAPLATDLNYDGRFTTDDLILYYQNYLSPQATSQPDGIDRTSDIIVAMQLLGYESGQTVGSAMLCGTNSLASRWPSSQVIQSRVTYAGSGVTRDIITSFGSTTDPRYRSVRHFDSQGRVQSDTFEIYRDGSTQLYSRGITNFDTSGNVRSQSTHVFDEAGRLRRLTATLFNGAGTQVPRSTDVWYFGSAGETLSRETRLFDANNHETGIRQFKFTGGKAVSVTTGVYASNGELVPQATSAAPSDANQRFNGGYTAADYLTTVENAYSQALSATQSSVAQVMRMNPIPAQANLDTILSRLKLPSAEASRYQHFHEYFQIVKSLAKARLSGDYSSIYQYYGFAFDLTTGDWSTAFSDFMRKEHLTVPLPPLKVSATRDTQDAQKITSLASQYLLKMGDNPDKYLQAVVGDPQGYEQGLLESMRKAKANIKLLELRLQNDGPPALQWMIGTDSGSLEGVGVKPIVALTYYYFFPYVNDHYILDQVDEATVKERVEKKLTNEDAIYVINIELWDPEGLDAVPADYLRQMRRATDLLHKYNPNLLVGYYRMLPLRPEIAAVEGQDPQSFAKWQATNDAIAAGMLDSVDVLFPSLYVLHLGEDNKTTEERWLNFAKESLKESQRIAEGRPIVPFLMLYYHRNGYDVATGRPLNPKANEWIEPELLFYQLAELDDLADGMVLYNDRPLSWNAMVGNGFAGALDLFYRSRQQGRTSQMRAKYESLLSTYHSELVAKLEAEKLLRQKQQQLSDARVAGDTKVVTQLTADISQLQSQLASAIDVFQLLKS